jgi:hypothetical protein
MSDVHPSSENPLVGRWVLLFPATFLVHIAEEYLGGFPARWAELTGLQISGAAFLGANALFWVLMASASVWILLRPKLGLLVVALATIVTINTVAHTGHALVSASYSPGLVSALVLWLPLAGVAFVRGRRSLSGRAFRAGVLIGVACHALVPVAGVGLALLLQAD